MLTKKVILKFSNLQKNASFFQNQLFKKRALKNFLEVVWRIRDHFSFEIDYSEQDSNKRLMIWSPEGEIRSKSETIAHPSSVLSYALQIEAHKNGAAGDVLCFAQNRVFDFPGSKSLNSKWKPAQHHVRTLPELKSTWFDIIENFLEFDEKKLETRWKQLLRELFEVSLKEICIKMKNWKFFSRIRKLNVIMIWEHHRYVKASPGSTLQSSNNGVTISDDMGRKIGISCCQ